MSYRYSLTLWIFFVLSFFTSSDLLSGEPLKRILVGSPICQKPAILREFLTSLDELEKSSYTLDYCFVDDNKSDESHQLLENFAKAKGGSCILFSGTNANSSAQYVCNEMTHRWTEDLVWKVAAFKDRIIKHALENKYDYLFLIDSDIVLHPHTLEQLIQANKEVVSNIFWTRWTPEQPELPQVWLLDFYTQFHHEIGEVVPPEEQVKRRQQFFDMLRQPGVYEVGGLGACTLINRAALEKGVNFQRIKNLTFWGEDRHFCVRASAIGVALFVDTHYPAYHIYRESELPGVEKFKSSYPKQMTKSQEPSTPRLTLSMIMKNEGDRYLRRVLESAKQYITDAVIIDDASSDNSVMICEEVLQGIPLHLVKNSVSKFSNEVELRQQQWAETIKTNPEWILNLDADEIFEDSFKNAVKGLIAAKDVDAYYFRLYDFWDENHYREDHYWQAHHHYRPFLVRYKPGMQYEWKNTAQHCGRFPCNISALSYSLSPLRLKHYGWAKKEDRIAKYERYKKLDPNMVYGVKGQYESILDETPVLITWQETAP